MLKARTPLGIGLSLFMCGCATDVVGVPMAIRDPLDLIDDVQGPLRLYVLPSDPYQCDPLTGFVTPEVPDVAEGMFEGAVADLSLAVSGSSAGAMLEVEPGSYTVLVRGKGTDPVSGRTNVFIATACATSNIAAGETREVALSLLPIVGMGVCGDDTLSPDEQCEDGGTISGDGCSATCRTEAFVINTTTAGVQNEPAVAGAAGRRFLVAYDNDANNTFLRMLEADGSAAMTPGALVMDASIDDAVPGLPVGSQLFASPSSDAAGRLAMAMTDFSGGQTAIRVVFFDQNRVPEAASAVASDAMSGNPAGAFAGNRAYMVAFDDAESTTGLSGQLFAAATPVPIAATPFAIGQGATGGRNVSIAGGADHFVIAFDNGDDVFIQRFATDGSARDATAIAAGSGTGRQDQASVAVLADGTVLVAWRDDGPAGDGAGTSVRARIYAADGTPGTPFVASSTIAGDQGLPQLISSATFFAMLFRDGTGARVRLFSDAGDPLPNRDAPPTTGDFPIGATITTNGDDLAIAAGGPAGSAQFMTVWAEGGDIRGRLFPFP